MARLSTQSLVFLCLTLPSLQAGDGLERAMRLVEWSDPIGGALAVADFDRDQKADGAVLLRPNHLRPAVGYRVAVHLSNRPDVELLFDSSEGVVEISARDIDHDNDPDVVAEQIFTGKGVKVWINDGTGGFREADPQDHRGQGKEAVRLLGARHRVSHWAGVPTSRMDLSSAPVRCLVIHPPDAVGCVLARWDWNRHRGSGHSLKPTRAPPDSSSF